MELQQPPSPRIEVVQQVPSFDKEAASLKTLLTELETLKPKTDANISILEEFFAKFSEYKKENAELKAKLLEVERKIDENIAEKRQSSSTGLESTLRQLRPLVEATSQLPPPSTIVPQSSKIPGIIPHNREALMPENPNTQSLEALIRQGNENLKQLGKGDLDLIITKKLADESGYQYRINALVHNEIKNLESKVQKFAYERNGLLFFKVLAGGAMCTSILSLMVIISLWSKIYRTTN